MRLNAQLLAVLTAVANRLKCERRREQSMAQEAVDHELEPMLDLVHGLPRTSKSEVVQWL